MKRVYLALLLVCSVSTGKAEEAKAMPAAGATASAAAEEIVADWTGLWGAFDHQKGMTPLEQCKLIECAITEKEGGVWQAKFEGECGRPYKYEITVDGRKTGDCIMFKGSADLGAADGGVYDWIGRANAKEFVGFYTNQYHTGTFRMTPKKTAEAAKPAAEAAKPAVN